MGKTRKQNASPKNLSKGKEPLSKAKTRYDSSKTVQKAPIAQQRETRSKRSIQNDEIHVQPDLEPAKQGKSQPVVFSKKGNKGQGSTKCNPEGLTPAENAGGAGVIVGSTKSLIDSLRGRKVNPGRVTKPPKSKPKSSGADTDHADEENLSDYDEQDRVNIPGAAGGDEEYSGFGSEDDHGEVEDEVASEGEVSSPSSQSVSSDSDSLDSESDGSEESYQGRRSRSRSRGHDDRRKLEHLRRDPSVQRLLDILYEDEQRDRKRGRSRRRQSHSRDRGVKRRRSRSISSRRTRPKSKSPKRGRRSVSRGSRTRSKSRHLSRSRSKSKFKKLKTRRENLNLKSPSDVMLYTPALRRDPTVAQSPTLSSLRRGQPVHNVGFSPNGTLMGDQNTIHEQISNLADRLRGVGERTEHQSHREPNEEGSGQRTSGDIRNREAADQER